MALDEYNAKRKFDKTTEPPGDADSEDKRRFVVQRHDARKLHYDLRLEIGGVLKSWAVPKGPSMNPDDKRLAIATEDHPVKYLTYQGVIPKGNYGAGKMDIWDGGTFTIINEEEVSTAAQYQRGDLKIKFEGEKLKGTFALVKMKGAKKDNQWLLIKKKDRYAASLAYDAEDFTDTEKTTTKKPRVKALKPEHFIKPMLATQRDKIFNDPNWLYEIKWDGYRVITHLKNGRVTLFSRNGQDYSTKFAPIAKALKNLEHDAILDGEMVIVDQEGVPNFQLLQNYDPVTTPGELRYYVFDLLYLNGHDTVSLPLTDRKSLLPEILEDIDPVFYCDHVEDMGKTFYTRAIDSGLEGVIAKKKNSLYQPGARTEDWLKIRDIQSDEAIICGYTDSQSGGAVFGSLILGRYEDEKLMYTGNCGSGFSSEEQQQLLQIFEEYEQENNPFPEKINLKGRKPHWMKPKLVCEVRFSERTDNGFLRHPVYKGLREDKNAEEVRTESVINDQKTTENTVKTTENSVKTTETSTGNDTLEVGGFKVAVSNLDKIYWPESGLRKYDLIDYYISVSDYILPYLIDRPQNLHRHPNGITGESFYQKDHETLPEYVTTLPVYSKSTEKNIDYLLCQNEASLLYLANLGCIELNPWNSRKNLLENPDYTVIDLDPSPANTFEEIITCAQGIKEILDEVKIEACCKTSGSRGLHIYIPLGANYTYEEARDFTKLLCYYAQERMPKLTTMERNLKKRDGKIYLDYLQNRKGQTLAAPYCVRPKKHASVSAPLQWEEVKSGLKIEDFTIKTMPSRLERVGDLFKPVLDHAIDMETILERFNA